MVYERNFTLAVEIVLVKEGVLSDDKHDAGGLTKYGISKRAYPDLDIANLTRDQAIAIYHKDYWTRCRCGELPWSLALPVFDSAVNQGQGTAIKLLQRAAGVTVDGVLGPVTLARALSNGANTLTDFMARRAKRYAGDDAADFERFGRGWFIRLFDIHRLALT